MTRRSPRPTHVGLVAALCAALLTLTVPTASSAPTSASSAEPVRAAGVKPWGRTRARNQVLKPGCRSYRYTYRVTPPSDDWMAEIFLVGPKKGGIASATLFSVSEPARGRRSWRLCRNTVIRGRYTMKMKVTWGDGYQETIGRVPSSRFRLTARR